MNRLFAVGVAVAMTACASQWTGTVGAAFAQNKVTHRVRVVEAPSGQAAARAGIEANDELITIDDVPVADLSENDIHLKLRGNVGTKVRLKLKRGEEIQERTVERGPIN